MGIPPPFLLQNLCSQYLDSVGTDAVKYHMYIGVVVGWQHDAVNSTTITPWASVSKATRVVAGFFINLFWLSPGWSSAVVRIIHFAGVENCLTLRTRWTIASRSVTLCKERTTQFYVCNTHSSLYLEWPHQEKKWKKSRSNSLALPSINKNVGTRCRSPSCACFFEVCSSPFMRLAEHHRALLWCKQCLPGWRTPNVLRPCIGGMRWSMVIPLRPCTNWVHPTLDALNHPLPHSKPNSALSHRTATR